MYGLCNIIYSTLIIPLCVCVCGSACISFTLTLFLPLSLSLSTLIPNTTPVPDCVRSGTYSRSRITDCVQKMWEGGGQYDDPDKVIKKLTAEVSRGEEEGEGVIWK
jgi:hypothetical protein